MAIVMLSSGSEDPVVTVTVEAGWVTGSGELWKQRSLSSLSFMIFIDKHHKFTAG